MDVIVNLIGIFLILLIVWWFIFSKPRAKIIKDAKVIIRVHDGIYDPAVITAKQGQTLHLTFLREDEAPCAEVVIFEELGVSATLPVNEPHDVILTIKNKGEFEFTCQMGMYRGKLIVK